MREKLDVIQRLRFETKAFIKLVKQGTVASSRRLDENRLQAIGRVFTELKRMCPHQYSIAIRSYENYAKLFQITIEIESGEQ